MIGLPCCKYKTWLTTQKRACLVHYFERATGIKAAKDGAAQIPII